MFYSNQYINDLIDAEISSRQHKQKTINGSLKLYLKQTGNVITIERDGVVEYRQEYKEGFPNAADDAFRVMSIH